MKIKEIFSYADIVDLRNEGKSDDEIIALAKAKKDYLNSDEYKQEQKLKEYHQNELKTAFDNGANRKEIELLRQRQNIQKARILSGADNKTLQNASDTLQKEQILYDRAKNQANAWDTFSNNLAKGWGNTAVGVGQIAQKLGINNERLNRGINRTSADVKQINDILKTQDQNEMLGLGSKVAGFVGEMADPFTTATLPVAFGKTLLGTFGKMAATELAAGTPRRLGESKTDENSNFWLNTAIQSGAAGVGGAGFQAIGRGLSKAFSKSTTPNAPENSAPNATSPENLATPNTDDLATSGSWMSDGNTPQNSALPVTSEQARAFRTSDEKGVLRGDGFVTDPNSAKVEYPYNAFMDIEKELTSELKLPQSEIRASLQYLYDKHPELFTNKGDVYRTIKELIINHGYAGDSLKNPNTAYLARRDDNKLTDMAINRNSNGVIHLNKDIEFPKNNDELAQALNSTHTEQVSGTLPIRLGNNKDKPFSSSSEIIPQNSKNSDEIIDLVPDENGVYQVAFNGGSKELTQIASDINMGRASVGADKIRQIAKNSADIQTAQITNEAKTKLIELKENSLINYANNTKALNQIAKEYPNLNKAQHLEILNQQIAKEASDEIKVFSTAMNGGSLPNDARMWGRSLGLMVEASLKAGVSKKDIVNFLINANIKGEYATAIKHQIQNGGSAKIFDEYIDIATNKLLETESQKIHKAIYNNEVANTLESAKAQAIENDKLLKSGHGITDIEDVTTIFKAGKERANGKDIEISESGWGRTLEKYDGQSVSDHAVNNFSVWEKQGDKANITLKDGRKVVYLSPDEAIQLSYDQNYLYGAKSFEELQNIKASESLKQKFNRLKKHPAYENLLKMRENTKASELKGANILEIKSQVIQDQVSDKYLRTKPITRPNYEEVITISKTDVKDLRDGKINEALLIKLENSLDGLQADPKAEGVLDWLLTRDYHAGDKGKKAYLENSKNSVDEVGENVGENSKILTSQEIKEQISKWDLDADKQTLLTNKVEGKELAELNEHFNFKGNYPITRQIDSEHIKHALNHHGNEKTEALRGQKAITLDDIANYENYAKNADVKEYSDKKVISKKQINGHFVVVEEALTGKNRLNFVSMWNVKGKIKDTAPISTPKNDLDRTLSDRYDAKNSSTNELKSQGKMPKGFKGGYTTPAITQALTNVMSGGVTGSINAANESDQNKKAEAFVKGFLLGFGGSAAASKLLGKTAKLAPQLARASSGFAKELPNLLNDRPDILGGVLGKINNAKDNFKNIFGGEKAIGANKAKLKDAKDMLENGVNEQQVWAKTGWYKDIDGKWKFEINPKGGKSEIFSDEISTLEGEIGTIEHQRIAQIKGKNLGQILKDDELFEAYPMLKDIKISAQINNRLAGSLTGDKMTLNLSLSGDELKSTLYHEVQHAVQDIEGFAKGTSPENMNLQSFKEWSELKAQALQKAREINKDKIAKMSDAERLIFDNNLQGFARDKANEQMYLKTAGEVEARNNETRLKSSPKEQEYIANNPQRQELNAQINKITKENDKLPEIMKAYKEGKISKDERDVLIKQNAENIKNATAQLVAKREMLDKKLAEEYLAKTHPYETMDIDPNERIMGYRDDGVSASVELEKDLLTSQDRVNTNALLKNASELPKPVNKTEFEAQFNANISGDSYVKTPIGDIKVNIKKAWEHFKKNTYNQDRSDLSGAFIHTLQDPLFIVKQNWKPTASPHTMGQSIAKSQNAKHLMDDRQQEIITQSTIFFKPFSDKNGGKYLASFAVDKNGELIQKTFYDIDNFGKIKEMIKLPENNVLYYKNARNQQASINNAEAQMRESFSDELKASYELRDGLLESAGNAKAKLSEKGKAELDKLTQSNDGMLKRDAEIMKTLEAAKSDPARYERLKKMYLDENGKVKDSVGLC